MARSSPTPRPKTTPRHDHLPQFAEDAVSRSLRKVDVALTQAAKPFRGDVEPVHAVRVSTRRAAATLQLFEDQYSKKLVKHWRKRLKRIRQAAGAARDADVLAETLTARKAESKLLAEVRAQQKPARKDIQEMRKKAKDKRWFKARLRELLDSLEGKDDVPLPEWIATRWEILCRDYLQRSPTSRASIDALHRFRIRTKSLRYQLELLKDWLPPRAYKQTLTQLIRIQDDLGKLIDQVTGHELLERLKQSSPQAVGRSPASQKNPPAIERSRKAFLKAWGTSRERELTTLLTSLSSRWLNTMAQRGSK